RLSSLQRSAVLQSVFTSVKQTLNRWISAARKQQFHDSRMAHLHCVNQNCSLNIRMIVANRELMICIGARRKQLLHPQLILLRDRRPQPRIAHGRRHLRGISTSRQSLDLTQPFLISQDRNGVSQHVDETCISALREE